MASAQKSREQRAADTKRYEDRRAAAGLVRLNLMVPIVRIGELDELLVTWRSEAKAQLEFDRPTADQILMIHALCVQLRLKIPVDAFATRTTAAEWLCEKAPRLAGRVPRLPRPRRMV